MAAISVSTSGAGEVVHTPTISPLDSLTNKKYEPLLLPAILKATMPFVGYSEIQQAGSNIGPVNTTYWVTG